MFNMSPIVRSYEELLVLSEQMLEAAGASNWDALAELQTVYMAEVERLRHLDHHAPFSDAERLRRFQLLERILAFDARIRDLTMPRLAHLGADGLEELAELRAVLDAGTPEAVRESVVHDAPGLVGAPVVDAQQPLDLEVPEPLLQLGLAIVHLLDVAGEVLDQLVDLGGIDPRLLPPLAAGCRRIVRDRRTIAPRVPLLFCRVLSCHVM